MNINEEKLAKRRLPSLTEQRSVMTVDAKSPGFSRGLWSCLSLVPAALDFHRRQKKPMTHKPPQPRSQEEERKIVVTRGRAQVTNLAGAR